MVKENVLLAMYSEAVNKAYWKGKWCIVHSTARNTYPSVERLAHHGKAWNNIKLVQLYTNLEGSKCSIFGHLSTQTHLRVILQYHNKNCTNMKC